VVVVQGRSKTQAAWGVRPSHLEEEKRGKLVMQEARSKNEASVSVSDFT
jgi:hypothetical protein